MSHALIIDENMIISRAIERRLESCGFDSFEHAWTEDQAVDAAALNPPDLVIVGDSIDKGSAVDAARRITAKRDVPVLMVTAHSGQTQRHIPPGATVEGPFHLSEIKSTLALARSAV